MNTTMSWLLRSDDGGSHTKRWGEYFISEGNVLLLLTEARSGRLVGRDHDAVVRCLCTDEAESGECSTVGEEAVA